MYVVNFCLQMEYLKELDKSLIDLMEAVARLLALVAMVVAAHLKASPAHESGHGIVTMKWGQVLDIKNIRIRSLQMSWKLNAINVVVELFVYT